MNRFLALVLALSSAAPAWAVSQADLNSADLTRAQATALGDTIHFEQLPIGADKFAPVTMRRIDIYAADARILVPKGDGYQEMPRSDWKHFVADRTDATAPRLGLSISADGSLVKGMLLAATGETFAIDGSAFGDGLKLTLSDASRDANGAPTDFVCQNDRGGWQSLVMPDVNKLNLGVDISRAANAASRSAVVAVDTDNEFMSQKFSNNTTNASNYLAQLFVAMNVIYERDLDLTLTQGTTILRTSGTPDPYNDPGTNAIDQLDEFGEVWAATQGGVSRAFAMQLSGKSASPNSASGIAWVLGNSNYCTRTNSTFNSTSCSDGQCTSGHYSVSQVFKFGGSTAANDVLVIAHELGHNFGADHTHCSDASTGAGTVSSNTIDQCFNGEAGSGCFSGAQVCPAPATVNGVANVRGTLMSYCHLSGISGCTSSQVFANAHRTLLMPRVVTNVTNGCFAGSAPDPVFSNGFE